MKKSRMSPVSSSVGLQDLNLNLFDHEFVKGHGSITHRKQRVESSVRLL
jgi:hypothetical protein